MAMVSANPRKGRPRMPAIISAECALSIGSKKTRCRSLAVLALSEAPMPAMVSARLLTRKSRALGYAARPIVPTGLAMRPPDRSGAVGLAPRALNGNPLRLQHLVLKGIHAGGSFVDTPDERDRALKDRLQALAILDTGFGVFVFDHQVRVGDVQLQQLARRELVIESIDGPILQVGQWVV